MLLRVERAMVRLTGGTKSSDWGELMLEMSEDIGGQSRLR